MIFLRDTSSVIWSLSADSNGILNTTPAVGNPVSLILSDANDNGWLLGINTTGMLTTTFVGPQKACQCYPVYVQLVTLTGGIWYLSVLTNGLLETIFVPQTPEIHKCYCFPASATNVLNVNVNAKSPGQYAFSGTVPIFCIDEPDDIFGTNTVIVPNQNQNIVIVPGAVHGRYDISTVINNPA